MGAAIAPTTKLKTSKADKALTREILVMDTSFLYEKKDSS
jgi:hypothetical protein